MVILLQTSSRYKISPSSDSGSMYNVSHLPGIDASHIANEVRSRCRWRAGTRIRANVLIRISWEGVVVFVTVAHRPRPHDDACNQASAAPSSPLVAPFTATLPGDVLSLDPHVISAAQQGKHLECSDSPPSMHYFSQHVQSPCIQACRSSPQRHGHGPTLPCCWQALRRPTYRR